jgi:hypothetical protein
MAAWTEERRRRQAEAIRKWKPWEKSTGPRTEAGKARSRMNALRRRWLREAVKLVRLNREFLEQARAFLELSRYDK